MSQIGDFWLKYWLNHELGQRMSQLLRQLDSVESRGDAAALEAGAEFPS